MALFIIVIYNTITPRNVTKNPLISRLPRIGFAKNEQAFPDLQNLQKNRVFLRFPSVFNIQFFV